MNKIEILVVEDEPRISEGLKDFLSFQGYSVTVVTDGQSADDTVKSKRFDLILLDLMLPIISGERLCEDWRESGLQTPIIMLTAKGQEHERVSGLNLGADDYITKPFSLEELLARIKAVLRRTEPGRGVGKEFIFGPWQVDISALKIHNSSSEHQITTREADLIRYFASNPNRVISRDELFEQVWHEKMTELGTRTIDMHIAKLRAKVEEDTGEPKLIKTVRGAGYVHEETD